MALFGHSDKISSVSFDPGGTHVLTSSQDETVRIWPIHRPQPSLLASWNDIVDYFQKSTRACLTADQRTYYLNETAEQAKVSASRCEE